MRVFAVSIVIALGGCGGTAQPATGAEQSSSGYAPDPAETRRCPDAAALTPPSLPSDAGPAAVVSFMKESVSPWVQARRAAVDECVDGFRSAAKKGAPTACAQSMLDASESALAFLDAYGRIANDISSALATDPETKSELLAAFRESQAPHLEMARTLLEECVACNASGGERSAATDRCSAHLEKTARAPK
jgi:hypothetical protein